MTTQETSAGTSSASATTRSVPGARADLKLEAIVIPVADVDRSKAFYAGLGWRLDADFGFDNGFRVVQFTPPGSPASVQFGTDITPAAPGSAQGLYLVVSDIQAARDQLAAHGVEVSAVFHPGRPAPSSSPTAAAASAGRADEGASYSSFATFTDPDGNTWLLQEVTTRLPGRVDPAATTYASVDDLTQALIRAATAHGEHEKLNRRVRRAVARLVRRVHGRRAGRRGPAALTGRGRAPCSPSRRGARSTCGASGLERSGSAGPASNLVHRRSRGGAEDRHAHRPGPTPELGRPRIEGRLGGRARLGELCRDPADRLSAARTPPPRLALYGEAGRQPGCSRLQLRAS